MAIDIENMSREEIVTLLEDKEIVMATLHQASMNDDFLSTVEDAYRSLGITEDSKDFAQQFFLNAGSDHEPNSLEKQVRELPQVMRAERIHNALERSYSAAHRELIEMHDALKSSGLEDIADSIWGSIDKGEDVLVRTKQNMDSNVDKGQFLN